MMERPMLEVRVEDKVLLLDGRSFSLDDSLMSGEVSRVIDDETNELIDGMVALELKYRGDLKFELDEEGGRIYDLIGRGGYRDRIEVLPCSADFPTVSLMGDLAVIVYR